METKPLNEKESLDLISRMIQNTQNNLESRGWKSMLIGGYTTIGISLLVYFLLIYTHNPHYNFLWLGILPIISLFSILDKKKHPKRVITYIDRVIGQVWLVLGITACIVSCIAFIKYIPILFIIALLINVGTTITGLVVKFRSFTVGGFIGIGLAFSLLFIQDLDSILVFCAIFIFCMVIPGHILYYTEKKNRLKQENHV